MIDGSHLDRIPLDPVPETVYLQPIGNAARYWDGKPLVGKVVKEARKYFYVAFNRGTERDPVKVPYNTFAAWNGNSNEGYLVYPTLEEFDAEQERTSMMKAIRHGFNVPGKQLSYRAVKTIYDTMLAEGFISD